MVGDNSTSIAILLNSPTIQEWERKALERVVSSDAVNASIDLVIVNQNRQRSSLSSQLQSLAFDFSLYKFFIAYQRLHTLVHGQPWYRERTPISDSLLVEGAEIIECRPIPADGSGNELPQFAVNALSSADIGVRFGFGILKGDALSAPQYGILSYHHGDLTKYRGRPPGFYEFVNGESIAGVTVQKLNEVLDGGDVAAMSHVNIESANSLREVQSRLFADGVPLLADAVSRCVNEPDAVKPPDNIGKLYTLPSNKQFLRYLHKRFARVV